MNKLTADNLTYNLTHFLTTKMSTFCVNGYSFITGGSILVECNIYIHFAKYIILFYSIQERGE